MNDVLSLSDKSKHEIESGLGYIFDTKAEGLAAVIALNQIFEDKGIVTVNDLFGLFGFTNLKTPAGGTVGWTDGFDDNVIRERVTGGFQLKLPPPRAV
jgi:hypothetical protein